MEVKHKEGNDLDVGAHREPMELAKLRLQEKTVEETMVPKYKEP